MKPVSEFYVLWLIRTNAKKKIQLNKSNRNHSAELTELKAHTHSLTNMQKQQTEAIDRCCFSKLSSSVKPLPAVK